MTHTTNRAPRGTWARNLADRSASARMHYVMSGRTLCGRAATSLHTLHVPNVGACRTCATILHKRVQAGTIGTSARALTRAELADYVNARRADLSRMLARAVADAAADGGDTLTIADSGTRSAYSDAPMGTRTVPITRRTGVSMADHASWVSPITAGTRGTRRAFCGKHGNDCIVRHETFTRMGGDTFGTSGDYVRDDVAEWVARATFTDRWHAQVMSTLTKVAHGMGRTPDLSERDDVAQDSRAASVDTLAALMTRADVTRTPRAFGPYCADVTTCGHDACRASRCLTLDDVGTFTVPRARRCGECDGCADADDRGMSRWATSACVAPVDAHDVVPPSQVLSRHVIAFARASMRTARRLGITTDGETTGDDAPTVDVDAFATLPDDVADLLARVMRVTYAAGDDVTRDGSGTSETFGNVLAIALGLEPSRNGRARALAHVREMRARADRAARAVVRVPSA